MKHLLVMVVSLAALDAVAGDPVRGETLYTARCGACHSPDDNGACPKHRGVVGRKAGTQKGYDYSDALKKSKLVWNEKLLNQWLEDPSALVPGNKMLVQLASDPVDRADIIAYLSTLKPVVKQAK